MQDDSQLPVSPMALCRSARECTVHMVQTETPVHTHTQNGWKRIHDTENRTRIQGSRTEGHGQTQGVNGWRYWPAASTCTCKHLLPLFSPHSCAYYFPVLLSVSVLQPCLYLCSKKRSYLITFMGLSFANLHPNVKPQMLPLRSSQPQWCYQLPWYFLRHKLFFPKGIHQSLAFPQITSPV